MKDVKCFEDGCDNQVRWRYKSKSETVWHFCNEHCKYYMNWNYTEELEMFTGNVPKKFQPSSHGALKPM